MKYNRTFCRTWMDYMDEHFEKDYYPYFVIDSHLFAEEILHFLNSIFRKPFKKIFSNYGDIDNTEFTQRYPRF